MLPPTVVGRTKLATLATVSAHGEIYPGPEFGAKFLRVGWCELHIHRTPNVFKVLQTAADSFHTSRRDSFVVVVGVSRP